jgi:Tfp pilus assembly ATPase PilU
MQTLDQNLSELLRQGLITRADALSRAQNKDSFA